ncbi:MAG TPA: RNA methyltransferase, partial [Candidatus Baltobacteraceae bacterium]|nr:RNA methyltransferase [Candidatus Baltobacteraceae bacterium]
RFGVDPHHPKVVRGSMGAIFRLAVATATPDEFQPAMVVAGTTLVGLTAAGAPITAQAFAPPAALVVGHERHGLGTWERLCGRRVAIPMSEPTESLNAAVAGSIALYEASRKS